MMDNARAASTSLLPLGATAQQPAAWPQQPVRA